MPGKWAPPTSSNLRLPPQTRREGLSQAATTRHGSAPEAVGGGRVRFRQAAVGPQTILCLPGRDVPPMFGVYYAR